MSEDHEVVNVQVQGDGFYTVWSCTCGEGGGSPGGLTKPHIEKYWSHLKRRRHGRKEENSDNV